MSVIAIRGEGITGSCCAHLLSSAGLDFTMDALQRSKLPAVLLSEMTQRLLRDVFGRDDLFEGFARIRRRVVAWGKNSETLTLPHSGVVVSEQRLLDRLQWKRSQNQTNRLEEPVWTIFASAPLASSAVEHHFGSRIAAVSPVKLKRGCDGEACWIESLENGWLFLLPAGEGAAWLLSVGTSPKSSLEASHLVKHQVDEVGEARGTFASHPRIALPLCEPGWLACGTAAVAFDPLCGDGVGNAVREAILASAVIRAAVGGGDVDNLAKHYRTRVLGGFQRHLALCFDFYKSGHSGSWWDGQLDDLKRGFEWCSEQLSNAAPSPRYRLNGFTLELAD
jgi:2-polyprenyl-6-methoxyphenol hydroxylase-like FAD-dependent oxidoreductase